MKAFSLERMATINEVSRLAGVSISTVSRVLNGTAPVAEETKDRVMQAIEKLEFHPNTFARSLVTNRSGGIGVTVNEISSVFYAMLLQGVENAVEAKGMHLLVSSGHASSNTERAAISFLQQRRSDALIIQVESLSDEELLTFAKQDAPVVIVGRYVKGLPCVYLDNEAGGFMATEYLIRQGHTRIAHITGPLSMLDGQARLAGYRRALKHYGLRYDKDLVIEGNFRELGGQEATHKLLERGKKFSAMFIADDQMAAGAMRALRQRNLQVPEDISIVGYDDVLLAEFLYPALTTIRQPLFDMGQVAADIALALLNHEKTEVIRKFEPSLVIRESVKTISSRRKE
jgi:LacI family transcriptional regulator